MTNVYEIQVVARCPVDPTVFDVYGFTITAGAVIPVELLVAFFKASAGERAVFQEELTAECAARFGWEVVSVGVHSGVKVTCRAP